MRACVDFAMPTGLPRQREGGGHPSSIAPEEIWKHDLGGGFLEPHIRVAQPSQPSRRGSRRISSSATSGGRDPERAAKFSSGFQSSGKGLPRATASARSSSSWYSSKSRRALRVLPAPRRSRSPGPRRSRSRALIWNPAPSRSRPSSVRRRRSGRGHQLCPRIGQQVADSSSSTRPRPDPAAQLDAKNDDRWFGAPDQHRVRARGRRGPVSMMFVADTHIRAHRRRTGP